MYSFLIPALRSVKVTENQNILPGSSQRVYPYMCVNLERMKGRLNQFFFALDSCGSASFLRLV